MITRAPDWLAGVELLAAAVVLVDANGCTRYLNPSAEQLFGVSCRMHAGETFAALFVDPRPLEALLARRPEDGVDQRRTAMRVARIGGAPVEVHAIATWLDEPVAGVLLEFEAVDEWQRHDREEQMMGSAQANRELVRNLAHEIKNPLGGIRGAAQLLESELPSPDLREYTQVVIKEADRLQALVDRLLAPHRIVRRMATLNIHEVFERVRAVVLAEYPQGLEITRDYDASLPDIQADKELLIQAVLNLVRNAAQALHGKGQIDLTTRVARQITISRQRYKLALDLHVVDNGPGVPAELLDRIFFPLVSGAQGGSGLGLSLAQTFVQQHGGLIECESRPGRTDFRVLLPIR